MIIATRRPRDRSVLRGSKRSLRLLLASLGFLTLVTLLIISHTHIWPHSQKRRAILVNGLYSVDPGQPFMREVINLLSSLGFETDVYLDENVTISLFMDIGRYDLVILRVHSAVYKDGFLYLFSGERYIESKYVLEQLAGVVRKGYTFVDEKTPYFALNSLLLGSKTEGGLRGSIVILMGCQGSEDKTFIDYLLNVGVRAYFAWNGYVTLDYVDRATVKLLKAIYVDHRDLDPCLVLGKIESEIGPDPVYGSVLKCFTVK